MPALLPNFVRRRACHTSYIATTRTCVGHLIGNLLAAIRQILFFVLERGSTPFARQPVPQPLLHACDLRQHCFQRLQRRRRRVQIWPRVRLVFLRDPPRAHVKLPWLSLVSLRPSCLDGCHTSLETLVNIL